MQVVAERGLGASGPSCRTNQESMRSPIETRSTGTPFQAPVMTSVLAQTRDPDRRNETPGSELPADVNPGTQVQRHLKIKHNRSPTLQSILCAHSMLTGPQIKEFSLHDGTIFAG